MVGFAGEALYYMTQLTIRGFDPDLEKRLHDLAKRDQLSLNKAALKLMRRGAGLEHEHSPDQQIVQLLQSFSGCMSVAEAEQIDSAIAQSRSQDLELQD